MGTIMRDDTRTALDPDVLDMLRSSLRHVLTEESTTPLADRLAIPSADAVPQAVLAEPPRLRGLMLPCVSVTLAADRRSNTVLSS